MSRATPQTRDFAKRLVAYESRGSSSSGTESPAVFYVCEKLRPQLAALMGKTGFHTLLSRALAVANAEDAWLRAVHVKADGSLGGLDEREAVVDPVLMAEGSVVLVSQLLGLLVAFVGEKLTLQMVREVWPTLSLNDLDFDKVGNSKCFAFVR